MSTVNNRASRVAIDAKPTGIASSCGGAMYMTQYRRKFPERYRVSRLRDAIRYCQRNGLTVTRDGVSVDAAKIGVSDVTGA